MGVIEEPINMALFGLRLLHFYIIVLFYLEKSSRRWWSSLEMWIDFATDKYVFVFVGVP